MAKTFGRKATKQAEFSEGEMVRLKGATEPMFYRYLKPYTSEDGEVVHEAESLAGHKTLIHGDRLELIGDDRFFFNGQQVYEFRDGRLEPTCYCTDAENAGRLVDLLNAVPLYVRT